MEKLGERLYAVIVKVHPELAPKLTGMLLQLGEEECQRCLEDKFILAEHLDEAITILDNAGGIRIPPHAPLLTSSERRLDPADGQARTFQELSQLCEGRYSQQEIVEYWHTCRPAPASSSVSSTPVSLPAQSASEPKPGPSRVSSSSETATGTTTSRDIPDDEAFPGLRKWLEELSLTGYLKAAADWAEEQGACSVDELVENVEDLAKDLNLKPLERKRLVNGAQAAADKAKLASAAAPASKDPEEIFSAKLELEEIEREKAELQRELQELSSTSADCQGYSMRAEAPKAEGCPAVQDPARHIVPKAKPASKQADEVYDPSGNRHQEPQWPKVCYAAENSYSQGGKSEQKDDEFPDLKAIASSKKGRKKT